jgi:hypothetical protein
MAGFEVVVRPAVLPSIRPAPARSLPPQDDPEKGFAVIRGNGANQVGISTSYNASTSTNKRKETQRRVDDARVYQEEDDGTVNKENFVDIEVPNKIWMKGPPQQSPGFNGDDIVPSVPGRGYTGDDLVPKSKDGKTNEVEASYYRPVQEKKNVEVKKRNRIVRNDEKVTP